MEYSVNQTVDYYNIDRQASFSLQSQEKKSYIYDEPGDRFTVTVPANGYETSLSHDFRYWIDFATPMTSDGYTDLSYPLQQGVCLEATSSDQLHSLYYIFLPPPDLLPCRTHVMCPLPEQFINYIAQKNRLVFLDLPQGRTSGVYPPDYWANHIDEDYPQGVSLTGRLIHPERGLGKWQLQYWKNVGGQHYGYATYKYTVVLLVSYEEAGADTWFTSAEHMLKPKR
jgi:hypothetical protein